MKLKKIVTLSLIWSVSITLFSQKVSVQVLKAKNVAESEWKVLDERYNSVISGDEYLTADSLIFSLEANKRFLFEISISQIYNPDTTLFKLYINNEPVLLINSDLTTGDHFFGFFTGTRAGVSKITGGTNSDISEFPWQVFFESGNFTCGGSIISGDWIITAAHCTEDDLGNRIPAAQMDVVVGANNPRNRTQGKRYFVSEVIVHENYNGNTLENDIALLKLNSTINFTNALPIKLVSKMNAAAGATDPGVMSWVTGYGITKVSPPAYPATLQKVQLPIVSNAQASTVWPNIASTDLMAGYLNGNKDACSGDSGGPLIVPVDGVFKLAGLVSWGSSNCNTYGAYTRVSDFESWIKAKTGIEISFVPPVPSGDSIVCRGVLSSDYNVGTVDGATAYEWLLSPFNAGTITSNSGQATVTWNTEFTGAVKIKLRVTRNNVVSDPSVLYVHLAKYAKILNQSGDSVMCAEQPLDLNVRSEGYNLVYSWFKNSDLVKSGKSADINLSSTSVSNSGIYFCNITGSCGSAVSSPMNLTVYPVTKITDVTPDSEVTFGGEITLAVTADGHNMIYQWQKDNKNVNNGNASDFTLNNVNASNTGLYQVRVTGTCGIVTSRDVYIYVKRKDFTADPEVFIWPTIVKSIFYVAVSNEEIYNLLLFDTTGKLLMRKPGCQHETVIDIAYLAKGMYILNIYNDNFRKSFKLIKG